MIPLYERAGSVFSFIKSDLLDVDCWYKDELSIFFLHIVLNLVINTILNVGCEKKIL